MARLDSPGHAHELLGLIALTIYVPGGTQSAFHVDTNGLASDKLRHTHDGGSINNGYVLRFCVSSRGRVCFIAL
jgi:hypothetical protein